MKWTNKSMVSTLLMVISLILLIVFVVIGVASFSFITNKLESNLLETTYVQSESIAKDVTGIFNSAATYTRQMSKNRDVIRYLKEVQDREIARDHPNYTFVYEYLVSIEESDKLHYLAWVANEKANFYLDSFGVVSGEDYDVKKRPWYNVAMDSAGVGFTEPYLEWSTNELLISAIMALRENADVFGFVVVDINLSAIPKLIETAEINENDKTFIISDDGKYMYHDNSDYIVNKSIDDPTDPLSSYKSQIMDAEKKLYPVTYNDQSFYLMSYNIGINDWKVVSLVDTDAVEKEISGIFVLIVSVMATMLAFALGAIYILVERRMAPFKHIVLFAEDIAEGDYETNIPKNYLDRPDEIGAISLSFQRIIDAFRNENALLEEKVSSINDVLEKQYAYILETEKAASLGNLVAGVSHEINTPLGVGVSTASHISALTHKSIDEMAKGTMSRTELVRYFENITEATRILENNLGRAAELVKSFKKIAVDQSSEIKERFMLKMVVEDVITSLRNEYKRRKHVITLECDDSIVLNSYPGLYAQLITNLMMNAIQHGFRNRYEGEIKIECRVDGQLLYIIFEDNGCGISEEDQKKVFEPFYTTFRENGNSGLGMSIIHSIITQSLKGKIQLESEVDSFTRFSIVLPIDL